MLFDQSQSVYHNGECWPYLSWRDLSWPASCSFPIAHSLKEKSDKHGISLYNIATLFEWFLQILTWYPESFRLEQVDEMLELAQKCLDEWLDDAIQELNLLPGALVLQIHLKIAKPVSSYDRSIPWDKGSIHTSYVFEVCKPFSCFLNQFIISKRSKS